MPVEPDTPIIAGQEFYYIYVQLKDYQAGRRSNDIMSDIVAELSKEQMQALATHFSKQERPDTSFRTDDSVGPHRRQRGQLRAVSAMPPRQLYRR